MNRTGLFILVLFTCTYVSVSLHNIFEINFRYITSYISSVSLNVKKHCLEIRLAETEESIYEAVRVRRWLCQALKNFTLFRSTSKLMSLSVLQVKYKKHKKKQNTNNNNSPPKSGHLSPAIASQMLVPQTHPGNQTQQKPQALVIPTAVSPTTLTPHTG